MDTGHEQGMHRSITFLKTDSEMCVPQLKMYVSFLPAIQPMVIYPEKRRSKYRIKLEKEMQCTPVFLLGKSHGQRSLLAKAIGLQRVGHD